MDLNEKWDDNLTLNYIESRETRYDPATNKQQLSAVKLAFSFYDCSYEVFLSADNVRKDWNSFEMEGESKLFYSVQDLLENEYWPKLKDAFQRYFINFNLLYNH